MFIKITARLLCIAILFVSSAPHFGLGIEKSYAQSAFIGSGNVVGSSTGNIFLFRSTRNDNPRGEIQLGHPQIHGGVEASIPFGTVSGFNTATHRANRFLHVPTPPTASLTITINPGFTNHTGFAWDILAQNNQTNGSLGVFHPTPLLPCFNHVRCTTNSRVAMTGSVPGGVTTHSVANLSLPLATTATYNRLGVMLSRRTNFANAHELFSGNNRPHALIVPGTTMGTVRMDYSIPYQIYEPFIENIEITDQGFVRITVNSGINVSTGAVRIVNNLATATLVRVSYVNGRAIFEDRGPQLGVRNDYRIMFVSGSAATAHSITPEAFIATNEAWRADVWPSIFVPTDPVGHREMMQQFAMITTKLNTTNSASYLNEFGDIQTAINALRADMASFENAPSYKDSFLKVISKLDLQGIALEKEIPGQRAVRTNSVRIRIATKDIAGLQMSFDGANWQNVPAGYFNYPLTANPGLKRIAVLVRDSFGNTKELRDDVWRL